MKPWADVIYLNNDWCLQQDSASAHMVNPTQAWCKPQSPNFINKSKWSAFSLDLNLLDFSIWGILEAKVNEKAHHSLESLKKKLIKERDVMYQ